MTGAAAIRIAGPGDAAALLRLKLRLATILR